MSNNMLVRKISLCHLCELWEWDAVKLGLLWHLLSKDLRIPYRHYSWGNESPQTLTQSQNMPAANQEKRQNSWLYCLARDDAPLPIATLREMLIYVSCFLDLVSPSVRLYYINPVSGGNASQTWHCCWSPATEHQSISVTVQNAGQLVFVYILRGRECPHPSGQVRCNFRERKGLASTVLARTHEVREREEIPKWWQGRPSVV